MATVASVSGTQPRTLFERTMETLNLPKSDINNLVMDFLIKEGYPTAAEKFAEEANIELKEDDTYIQERVQIRDLIFVGNMQQAIEDINEVDPELLDKNKRLHFSLLRLQLIELIKKSFAASEQQKPTLIGDAIQFAQNNLAPYAPLNDEFKTDLERAMALLIVPQDVWRNQSSRQSHGNDAFGSLKELVDPDLRAKVARDVNQAILKSQGKRGEANIHQLLQTRAWTESLAREKDIQLPETLDLGLDDSSHPTRFHNGHAEPGDTEMTENGGEGTSNDPVARYTNTH